MNEYKTPELSLEDMQYEREAKALEVQVNCLSLAIEALAEFCTQSIRNLEPLDNSTLCPRHWQNRARANSAKMVLIAMHSEIKRLIGSPDEGALWTSDECSAQIVEEFRYEAVQECQRIADEIDSRQRLHLKQYGTLERSSLIDVMETELHEAQDWRERCEDSLAGNPKSDWIPF